MCCGPLNSLGDGDHPLGRNSFRRRDHPWQHQTILGRKRACACDGLGAVVIDPPHNRGISDSAARYGCLIMLGMAAVVVALAIALMMLVAG